MLLNITTRPNLTEILGKIIEMLKKKQLKLYCIHKLFLTFRTPNF